ncbi:MAG: prepilin-type N-terminal cleavage/methylation domain-containing protein [Lachnospiraceae bacterium]|nr:prepilin-type N-terminal cleavage/methylation domain-containing protein [Lachnospiraceae bacterium]
MSARINSRNKGFTLVELLIVLVILAILAAIIIPVTLSIIDNTDEVQIASDAKNIWNSVQTCMMEQLANDKNYLKKAAESDDTKNRGVPMNEKEMDEDYNKIDAKFDGSYAFDFSSYELASRMLKKIDNADQMKFIYYASGRFIKYYLDEDNMDKAYTTYLVIFQYKDDDTTYYYDGKDLKEEWPLTTPSSIEELAAGNELFMNSKGQNISVQLYCVKKLDKNGNNDSSKAIAYLKKNIKSS